jgi:hypothetical protein
MKFASRALFALVFTLAVCASSARAAGGGAQPISAGVSFTSDLLSNFWHRSTVMRAMVYVPARCVKATPACPVLYHLPGYGSSLAQSWSHLSDYNSIGKRHPNLAMTQVFLDPNFMGGFQYFTDSENYGPWNSALTQEFIPYLERKFHMGGDARGRFLVGASSGGWAVLWLQVSNPQFFNGVWTISPDPSDFRYFYQVDITPGSKDNFYYRSNGSLRPLMRGDSISMKALMQTVDDNPRVGGIISSYEWSWSPKGPDGLPLRFFDRSTGKLIEKTLEAWQNFDIHSVLLADLDNLRAQLAGKINLYVGSIDTFFYNQPGAALCSFLHAEGFHSNCHVIPGRDHSNVILPFTLYPHGLHYYLTLHSVQRWNAALASQAP